jgi:hypothetical protein
MVRPEPRCLGAWGLPRVLLPPFPWIPPPGCWGAAFCWVLGGQPWRPALCYRGLLQDGLPPSPTPLPFSFPRLETSNHWLGIWNRARARFHGISCDMPQTPQMSCVRTHTKVCVGTQGCPARFGWLLRIRTQDYRTRGHKCRELRRPGPLWGPLSVAVAGVRGSTGQRP